MLFELKIKRIYEAAEDSDGSRILVDRLWPRGMTKDAAKIRLWMKEIAPSNELRKSFHSEMIGFKEFRVRYEKELDEDTEKQQKVAELIQLLQRETVTLLYGAKERETNHANVIKEFVLKAAANA